MEGRKISFVVLAMAGADSMWQPCVGVMTVKFPQH